MLGKLAGAGRGGGSSSGVPSLRAVEREGGS